MLMSPTVPSSPAPPNWPDLSPDAQFRPLITEPGLLLMRGESSDKTVELAHINIWMDQICLSPTHPSMIRLIGDIDFTHQNSRLCF